MHFSDMIQWALKAASSNTAKQAEMKLLGDAITKVSSVAAQKAPDYAPAIDSALQSVTQLAVSAILSKTAH